MHDRARCWPSSGLRDVALQHVWGLRVVLLSLRNAPNSVLFAVDFRRTLCKLCKNNDAMAIFETGVLSLQN
jgi:hypothetical protein